MPDERPIDEVIAETRRFAEQVEQLSTPEALKRMLDKSCVPLPDALRLCDEIERMTTMLESLPYMVEQAHTYLDDDEMIVLSQSSYNQLREDAGWPVVWSSKNPKHIQAWRGYMPVKGDE